MPEDLRTPKIPKAHKALVLKVARVIYGHQGYAVKEGYDFTRAVHPQERGAWNLACEMVAMFRPWGRFLPRMNAATTAEFQAATKGLLPEEMAL